MAPAKTAKRSAAAKTRSKRVSSAAAARNAPKAPADKTARGSAGPDRPSAMKTLQLPPLLEIQWKNLRGFEDTGRLGLPALTVLIGANSSGKTSVLAPLLLLKQTLEARIDGVPIVGEGPFISAGRFRELVRGHDLARTITFELGLGVDRDAKAENAKLGTFPPAGIELTLSGANQGAEFVLERYRVFDRIGRTFLTRRRLESGDYSLEDMPEVPVHIRSRGAHATAVPDDVSVARARPDKFLFTADAVIAIATEQEPSASPAVRTAKAPTRGMRSLQLSPATQWYITIIDYAAHVVRTFLSSMSFVGPIRAMPRRVYELSPAAPRSVGADGQFAPELLFRQKGLLPVVNAWMRRFEFGENVQCDELSSSAFSVSVERTSGAKVNWADTGFGLSQTLPLVVQVVAAKAGDTIIVEQPEIHLNPKLQCVVADLLQYAVRKGCRVIVETHSEHMFLRLRRLVAEKTLKHDEVGILYVERNDSTCSLRRVSLSADGGIPRNEWPEGFFEDSLREALALALAQSAQQPS